MFITRHRKINNNLACKMQGVGINTFNPNQKQYPLVSGTDIAQNSASKDQAMYVATLFNITIYYTKPRKQKESLFCVRLQIGVATMYYICISSSYIYI